MDELRSDWIKQQRDALLAKWGLDPGCTVRLLNISENETYLVENKHEPYAVLRLHRPRYHSLAAIQSEISWSQALREDAVVATPAVIAGVNDDAVQTLSGPDGELRHSVLYEFVPGLQPRANDNLAPQFERLGKMAAALHAHSKSWKRPEFFTRHSWDTEAVFGPEPTWGNWRDGPMVTPSFREPLAKAEGRIIERLATFGRADDRYGLIHADMRLANLLVDADATHLIDFDDCGFGWFLYDFAAAISFMEDHPQIPRLKAAWVRGYRARAHLSANEEAEMDTFVMLRRLALLAWMSTHPDVEIVRELSPTFAKGTVRLAEQFLTSS